MNFKKLKLLALTGTTALTLHSAKSEALLAGVKTSGMAATSVAYPIDAFAGAYNPASITGLCNRMDAGISWVYTHQGASIVDLPCYSNCTSLLLFTGGLNPCTLNCYHDGAKTANTYVPEFGINKKWNICCNWYDYPVEFSTSFIVYNRNEMKTTYGSALELFGTTPLGLEYIHETAALVNAVRFFNMHSFGIAINYNIQRIKIDGLEHFQNALFSVSPDDTTNRGYNYSNGVGVVLGYLFEWKCVKIGAGWQPKTHMKKFNKYQGFIADHGSFDLPERYTAGISYKPMCDLAFAFDWEYIKWRQIPQLRNPTFLDPENCLTIFPNISPSPLLGAKNGPGFGFNDQAFFRVGVEYNLLPCITLRTGFRHANSPVKEHWTAANMLTLDCMENVFTFGGTWKINACNEINIFYGLGLLKKVAGKESIPSFLRKPSRSNPHVPTRFPINMTTCNTDPCACCVCSENDNDTESDDTSRACCCQPEANPSGSLCSSFNLNNFADGAGEVNIKQRRCVLGISWGYKF